MTAPRQARCDCGKTVPSDQPLAGYKDLPFFQDRGPESLFAETSCTNCRYHQIAHTVEKRARISFICAEFTPGPHEFDSFYCGCRGWD